MFSRKRHQMRRLYDLACLLAKQVLSQLSYTPIVKLTLLLKHSFARRNRFLRILVKWSNPCLETSVVVVGLPLSISSWCLKPGGASAQRQRAGPSFNLRCVRHHEYDTQLWHHWAAMFAIRHRRKYQRNGDPKY